METVFAYLIVFLFSGLISAQEIEDPCQPAWHAVLDQSYRSTGYDTRPSDTPYCDNHLQRGWYRFAGFNKTVSEISTECPDTNTCGTVTPIWMNGSHPDSNDGIVLRRLCGRLSSDGPNGSCCGYQDVLFVKKCESFYVYYLNPTRDCPSAYCAGTAQRCPENKWSSTNFQPCRDLAPILETLPVVKGPNINANQSFDFKCEIVYGPNDADQVFSVLWTFNNKSDPAIKPELLTGDQRVATLSGDKLKEHLDSDVGCQVSTYYLPEKNKNTYKSKPHLFGVQALTLTGPNVRNNTSFDFECEVIFGSTDPGQQIEVIWTFDGVQDPEITSQIITGQERKATLAGSALKTHLNTNIGCQARLIYDGYGIKTEFRKSNTYFAGIQISTSKLEIHDSEGDKEFTVTSTIPVVCNQSQDCCLIFRMEVDKNTVVSLKNTCEYRFCFSDWDDETKQTSFNVTLVPYRNTIGGVSRDAVLSFKQLVLSGSGPYIDIFKEYQLNPVQVVVTLETGFKCSITGDPHFQGFDFRGVYDLYTTGDFIVYAVQERDFLVQMRSWPCWSVTCVCGIVVKEKNDIIKVHGCDKPNRLSASTVDISYQLSPGTSVQRSSNGQHVGILLSSGSEVKIDIQDSYMNVYIQTPAYDKNKAAGICGTNDGNPDNDFTHPDGTVTPVCRGSERCIPVSFTDSWRVNGSDSMFVTAPKQVQEEPSSQYCSCPISSTEAKPKFICSHRQHIQENKLACMNCREITDSLKPSPWGQPGQKVIAYEHKTVKPVDPKKRWPNDQGLTEVQSRELCSQAIQKSQLYPVCRDVDSLVKDAMAECLGDILNGGTSEALNATTSSFTSKCKMTLAADEGNYQLGQNGDMTLNPEINELVCPVECLTHGKCGQGGKCECQTGWEGETCQIEKGKGPQINYTTGGPVCTASQKSCESVQFYKSNVNIFDSLKCRVQTVDNQNKKTGQPHIFDAANDSSTVVTCPLPKIDLSAQNYTVSVTTDGITYGNELPVYTFDSTCLDWGDSGCQQKKTACLINNICYRNGETNKNNQKELCDISKSLTKWSVRMIPTSDSSTTTAATATSGHTTFGRISSPAYTASDSINTIATSDSSNLLQTTLADYSTTDNQTKPNITQLFEQFVQKLKEMLEKMNNQ